jgi:4-hydroxybenzoyl-CoA reductase subunit alpha
MEYAVIGKRLPRIDAPLKATGEAKYTADLSLPGMLFGKTLKSPYAHARILKLDTSRAERLPGVKAVISGQDAPRKKYGFFRSTMDQVYLPRDKVRFIGEEIAAVAAIDEDIAEEALGLIEVEYEELPAVFDPEEALQPDAPRVHEEVERNLCCQRLFNFGDIEKGFQESDYIREDRFTFQAVIHASLEPHACLANFDATGKITLWTTTQIPFLLRRDLSRLLDIPLNKIRVIKPFIGGGFGGKAGLCGNNLCAVLLSQKSGRPVKMVYSREEEFVCTWRKIPMIIDLKTGVKKDGKLVAQHSRCLHDGGAYSGTGILTLYNTGLAHLIPMRLPNFKYEGYRVYTNKPPCGAQRGHGQNQPRYAVECQLDMIAEDLGMDPLEIRLKNATQPGDVTVNRLRITSCGLSDALKQIAAKAEWRTKRGKKLGERGIGIGCGGFVCGARFSSVSAGSALIKLEEDGAGVTLITGASDIGQGSDTILAQIVAEELGLGLGDIKLVAADTDATPFDGGSGSSRVTFYAGNAARLAAIDIRKQLAQVAADQLEAHPEDLIFRDRLVYVKGSPEKSIPFAEVVRLGQLNQVLLGRGSYMPSSVEWPDKKTFAGNVSGAYSFSAQAAEVEIDQETGQIRLAKLTLGDDCGFPLNPMSTEGQAEGSASMGQGQATLESICLYQGQIFNPSLLDYKIPTVKDSPEMETHHVITNDPEGPYGAKEIGEGYILSTAPAIANAIHDALGIWLKDLPITPDKVLQALAEKEK